MATRDTLVWDEERLELEIADPAHVTYVPLQGNRCWALVPTNLDWYCYCAHIPNFMRILRRLGLYLQLGTHRGRLQAVLQDVHTYYGANYLRIDGHRAGVYFDIRVFPDVEESLLYLTVSMQNRGSAEVAVRLMVAADFEIHPVTWGCKGFTEDATGDYSGLGRMVNTPRDDHVLKVGTVFFCSDSTNPGVGFMATGELAEWTLDRSRFSYETPFSGYRPHRLDQDHMEWSCDERSDDSLCVFLTVSHLRPGQQQTQPIVVGYQERADAALALAALSRSGPAFEATKKLYQKPILMGVHVETPDPMVNAQFSLYSVFIKMNEHHHAGRTGFLPAAHYFNWLCGDSMMALPGYVYANDWEPVVRALDLFQREQLDDGFISNLPLWTTGASWRERGDLPIVEALNYIIAFTSVIKIIRDRALAEVHMPSLRKAMHCVLRYEKEGLIYPGGAHGYDAVDWPCGFGDSPQTFASVCTYKSLLDLGALAQWLGEEEYAAGLRRRAATLKETINDKLWMEDRGYYRVGLPVGQVGQSDRDRQLFSQEMISWGSLVAVVWGVADQEMAGRVISNIRQRLWSPWGMKFIDPPWSPSYTDSKGITYAAGRQLNGAYWLCWYSTEYLIRAQILQGDYRQAFADLLEIRLDNVYRRCTMSEKGRDLRFVRSGEWIDTDLTFPVTSIPYTLTAAFYNQALVEAILGITVEYDRIRIEPHLPCSWPGARLSNLTIGDSVWDIQIRGNGNVSRITMDGEETSTLPIETGRHSVEVTCV